jgi:hypothetical protein
MRNAFRHRRGSKGAQPLRVLRAMIEPGGHAFLLRARLSALHVVRKDP